MEIFVERENKTIDHTLKEPTPLNSILKELKISSESVILVKNDEICLEDELVCDDDKVKLLSVISGG